MVKAPQAILMDAESGGVMYQRNGDELMYPASMSKLMTLAVVFKALKAGEIKPRGRVLHERVRLAQGRRSLGQRRRCSCPSAPRRRSRS